MINVHVGRYYYGNSLIHRLDPRAKIISFVFLIISIFITKSPEGFIIISLFIFSILVIVHIPFRLILSYIRPMYWLFLVIIIMNFFFSDNNSKDLFPMSISQKGLFHGIKLAYQLLLITIGSSVLITTTMPIQIANAISQLLHLHQLPIMLMVTLAFIPKLLLESERLISIQKIRGTRRMQLLKNGSWLIVLMLSLLHTAFRLADDMVISMESRCYSGMNRTHLYDSNFKYTDILALALSFSIIPIILIINFWR